MNYRRSGSLALSGATFAWLAVGAAPLVAQNTAVITGRVVSERGDPLGGAAVIINNTNFGATTAPNGSYTITITSAAARGQTATIIARFLGYKPASRQVQVNLGTQEQNFTLELDPLRLEEMVVTGVSEATSTKKLTFSVGKVNEAQLQEVPGTSAIQALQGKVSGVRIVTNTGEPGAAPNIKLRGATSISGRQDPLIIVDGTITRATLADIAGEDIERIEVVKGAAASSLYGSNAANGVIQIFTKRGANLADGKLQVIARGEAGLSKIPRTLGTAQAHVFKLNPDGSYFRDDSGEREAEEDGIADNPYPRSFDQLDRVIETGQFYSGYLSVGQRKGNTNFHASFQTQKNEGIVFGLNGYERQNFRINVDQQLAQKLDASFSAFYGHSTNGRAAEGPGSPFFAITFVEPDIDLLAQCTQAQVTNGECAADPANGNPDGSPYRAYIPDRLSNAANPLYELSNRKIETNRNRFTGSARARWRVLDWLSAEGSFNYDQEQQEESDETPFGFLQATGNPSDGNLLRAHFNGRTYNTNATLTAINTWGKITNTTKVAYIFEDQEFQQLRDSASTLIVSEVPHFSGTDPASVGALSETQIIRSQNLFAVTTFDINDRYILDGLIRRDGSSLFGPEERWQTYYRLSGAWRANEDLKISGIDELRLRASYGTAGLRPGYNYQYEILSPSGGSFLKQTLGNRFLKPAHSSEFEAGVNVEFGNSRFTMEYTYARKNTKDQILQVDLLALQGYANQWQNSGSLKSTTHEIAFGAQLINSRDVAWQLNIVADRTRQVITEWVIPINLYGFGQMPAIFYLDEGATLGEMRGQQAVRNIEDLYRDPAKAALSGPGQAWSRDSVLVNEEGFVVRRNTWRTTEEKPLNLVVCDDAECLTTTDIVKIGDANPDFNMSFSSTFNFKRLAVTGLVDWTQGGNLYNGTRQWPYFDNRDPTYDQRGKPEEERKPQQYYNYFYNGLSGQAYFVESGTYVKLKELAVNYTFNRDQLGKVGLGRLNELRLGLIGRNLLTLTDYTGYDPEVSGLNGDPFQVRIDWFQYPQFRTLTALVEIAF